MVSHYQDVLLFPFPRLQAQVVDVNQLQRIGHHNILHRGPLLLQLEDDVLVALLNMLPCLYSHLRPDEMVVH